jgi:hypothetical protein
MRREAYLQPLPTCSNGESGTAPPDRLQKHRDHNEQVIFLTELYSLLTISLLRMSRDSFRELVTFSPRYNTNCTKISCVELGHANKTAPMCNIAYTWSRGKGVAMLISKLTQTSHRPTWKFRVFLDVAPRSHVEVDRRFRGAYCLHH